MRTESMKVVTGAAVALLFVSPIVAAVTGTTPAGAPKEDWSHLQTGRDVYQHACVACHGTRGRGADSTLLGFDPSPPNFTDCQFTSREFSSDWVGIASKGGPLKGFSRMMPSFEKSLTRPQLEKVVAYIKDFCTEKKWPPGEFNLPKALNTGKAFLENEASWSFSSTFKEPVSLSGDFAIAMRVGARHQIEAAIPFEVKQVEETRSDGSTSRRWGEGVGDIAAAWKSALWFTRRGGNIGSLTLDVFFPTGDEADDMGSGIFVLEPAFAFAQIIPYVGFLQLQVGAELSTNIDTQNHVVFWRGAFGRSFRKGGFGRTVSPMVEVLGEKEIADGTIISWDVVPELQIALSKRQHVRFGAGLVIPVTEFQDRQLTLMAYLLWDWYDGGFFEGWK